MTSRNNGRYETYIDYNSNTDYGLDLNYKLYYYFKYFEETNKVKLYPIQPEGSFIKWFIILR